MAPRRLLSATIVVFAHFASGDHGIFSVRNREGRTARVDLFEARAQGWGGDPVSVTRTQILAR
jgi:hypothetical protein